jgi:hypothetical protein
MNTPSDPKKLVDTLVRDLKPSRRSPSLTTAIVSWLALSTALGIGGVSILHFRPNLNEEVGKIEFSAPLLLLFLIASLLGLLAIKSGTPGRDFNRWSPLTLFSALGAIGAFVLLLKGPQGASFSNGLDPNGLRCSMGVAVLATAPAVLLFGLLKHRYASVSPRFTGRVLGLSAGLLGSVFIAFHCSNENGAHFFAWHFIPVILISIVASKVAVKYLRF